MASRRCEVSKLDQIRALGQLELSDLAPWVDLLPASDAELLLAELAEVVQCPEAAGDSAPVETLLAQWRHSAEVYADPALVAIPTREPEGDLGPVPVPSEVPTVVAAPA